MIYIKKIDDRATLPGIATPGSAGLDLHALETVTIAPGSVALVRSGIAAQIQHGYEGQVRGRSGLAVRGIFCHVGTIDSDYRGEIKAVLLNTTSQEYQVRAGDRFAQLVIAPIVLPNIVPVLILPETERGTGGFGSSGQ